MRLECTGALDDGEFTSSILIVGNNVTWCAGDDVLATCDLETFFALAARLVGQIPSRWAQQAEGLGIELDFAPVTPLRTRQTNLVKATLLIATWAEPDIRRANPEGIAQSVEDQVIIDYTGRPGPQPYLYFLAPGNEELAEPLYEIGLLAKLVLDATPHLVRHFKPLVTPVIRRDELGRRERRLWDAIKWKMEAKLRRASGAQ